MTTEFLEEDVLAEGKRERGNEGERGGREGGGGEGRVRMGGSEEGGETIMCAI